uniref:Uncharacterized protein n=1 Tax=Nitzschia putrida TaxID=2742595 RepID=A0A7R7TR16_9STRA|nr:hypothetical protein [Nitzschia putrida]BCQ06591.1 hypothetical protein [Nitzschia putrida]
MFTANIFFLIKKFNMSNILQWIQNVIFGKKKQIVLYQKLLKRPYNYKIVVKAGSAYTAAEHQLLNNGQLLIKTVPDTPVFKKIGACQYDLIQFNKFLIKQNKLHLAELKRIADEKIEYIFRGTKTLKIILFLIKEFFDEFKRTFKIKLFIRHLLQNKSSAHSLRLLHIIYIGYSIKRDWLIIKRNRNNKTTMKKLYSVLIILKVVNCVIEIKNLGTIRIKPIKNSLISFGLFETIYQILFFFN